MLLHEVGSSPDELPSSYGETRVVLLPVDPYLVHAYWDLSRSDRQRASSASGALRFFDVTSAEARFDVEIELAARNWYVPLRSPGKSYRVELGRRTEDGEFVAIAGSNPIEMPRASPSADRETHHLLVVGDYEQVEPIPAESRVQPRGSDPQAPPSQGSTRAVDAPEIMRSRVAEPLSRPEGPPSLDLAEMCEAMFSPGLSSHVIG
ncbi:MAG: DUF4912 domain-containing protein [Actinomycetota bacterium]